ncbi:hypothetical protein [Novosphingobium sp. 9]|uniref:hypothetical protein n=1 Tax=Novosphingobium sp. 9 TaxID=2025349 RepID=UPI0021B51F59|nr:hypothetical protein [Novosphingobium sp. 9]
MQPAKDLLQLSQRVAASHGWAAAKAFKGWRWSEADQATIASTATALLKVFPGSHGHEAALSAALAVQLERQLGAPVQLVAGTLSLDGVPVIGDRQTFDGPAVFSQDEPDFAGHLWVMAGGHVIDIALFRLAASPECPPELARHVHLAFGQGKGLYADRWRGAKRSGLSWEPQYVLSEAEVTGLMGTAFRLMTAAKEG